MCWCQWYPSFHSFEGTDSWRVVSCITHSEKSACSQKKLISSLLSWHGSVYFIVFSSPLIPFAKFFFGMGEGHTGANKSRFDSGRDNTISQIVHLFLLIPSRNPILQNASILSTSSRVESRNICWCHWDAGFHSLKAPILGESCVAQPNHKRMQAHKSWLNHHLCHDVDHSFLFLYFSDSFCKMILASWEKGTTSANESSFDLGRHNRQSDPAFPLLRSLCNKNCFLAWSELTKCVCWAAGSTTRRYAAASGGQAAAEEVTLGNEEYLEPGQVAKRFAVGTTAVTPEELSLVRNEEEDVTDGKTKAKQVLQSVGEKLKDVQDGREERELQEKLVSTQGIGDVVQDMYNQKETSTVLWQHLEKRKRREDMPPARLSSLESPLLRLHTTAHCKLQFSSRSLMNVQFSETINDLGTQTDHSWVARRLTLIDGHKNNSMLLMQNTSRCTPCCLTAKLLRVAIHAP